MATSFPNINATRIADRVLTKVVHGYVNANSIAPFVAPVVTVGERFGRIKKFDKSSFAVVDTRRSPGDIIKSVSTGYTSEVYELEQHAISGEVTEEEAQEALRSQANVDLRKNAALRAADAIAQSWEAIVTGLITNAAIYEATNVQTLSGTAQFDNPASQTEITVQEAKEAVRSQLGIYPNAGVMDVKTLNALRQNAEFKDRIKFTNAGSVTLDMIASWYDLPMGIKISARKKLDPVTGLLEDIMPEGKFVIFYHPDGGMNVGKLDTPGTVFKPTNTADRAKPAAWYTYMLSGYPIAVQEYLDPRNRTYQSVIIAEQSIVPVGLGVNGLCGASYLLESTVSGT